MVYNQHKKGIENLWCKEKILDIPLRVWYNTLASREMPWHKGVP